VIGGPDDLGKGVLDGLDRRRVAVGGGSGEREQVRPWLRRAGGPGCCDLGDAASKRSTFDEVSSSALA
jgi:hypothetical protein